MKTIRYLLCASVLFALGSAKSSAQQPTFKLPFAPSASGHFCTNGNFGAPEFRLHQSVRTRYALDFNTPNTGPAQNVLAAADGIAYGFGGCSVGDTGCNHGFGNYVKIDHGNGIYTVYAHLETIRVSTTNRGSIVKQGNAIGTEGATGQAINETGDRADHIHFGVNTGDPTVVEPGTSILIEALEVIDLNANSGTTMVITGAQAICGLTDVDPTTPEVQPAGHHYDSTNLQTVRPGDLNGDDKVNCLDFSLMNVSWFTDDATSDLNRDGIVNSIDFSILNSNWNT